MIFYGKSVGASFCTASVAFDTSQMSLLLEQSYSCIRSEAAVDDFWTDAVFLVSGTEAVYSDPHAQASGLMGFLD